MTGSGGRARGLTLYGDRCVKKCHILTARRCPVRPEKNYNDLFLLMIFILHHFNNGTPNTGTEFA